jgi:hypothetical protein
MINLDPPRQAGRELVQAKDEKRLCWLLDL